MGDLSPGGPRGPHHWQAILPVSAIVALVTLVGLMVVAWFWTFGMMWLRWYPAWANAHKSLKVRLTAGDSYYTHGPIVPLVCLGLAYMVYKRVGMPVRRSRSSTALGWVCLLGFLGLHVLSVYARVMFVSGFCIVGVLGSLTMLMGGWTFLRAYALPIAFLGFMIPLPMDLIANINFGLKSIAGQAAVWVTNHMLGIPALIDGAHVHLAPYPDGSPKMLVIENACSGLRSIIALTFFASLFAMVCRVKGPWRLLMLALAVPVAVFSNIVRITGLNTVAHHFGTDATAPGSLYHDFSGLGVFAIALGVLFGIEKLVLIASEKLNRNWTEPKLLGFLDRLPKFLPSTLIRVGPGGTYGLVIGLMLVFSMTAVGSVVWSRQSVAQTRSNMAANAVPPELRIGDRVFDGMDFEQSDRIRTILETDDILSRRFDCMTTGETLELLVVFSRDNRKGTHAPEVCLEANGERIASKSIRPISSGHLTNLKMRELVTRKGDRETLHLYTYKCGDSYTPSYWTQQAVIFANGITARNTAGALIRFQTPIYDQRLDTARQLLVDAAEMTLQEIDNNLP